MTPAAILRHARCARTEARRLAAEGSFGLAAVRARDATMLEHLATAPVRKASTPAAEYRRR